jgi:hypothetical protein
MRGVGNATRAIARNARQVSRGIARRLVKHMMMMQGAAELSRPQAEHDKQRRDKRELQHGGPGGVADERPHSIL